LPALLEFIQPADRGDDALLTAPFELLVLDYLKVHEIAG